MRLKTYITLAVTVSMLTFLVACSGNDAPAENTAVMDENKVSNDVANKNSKYLGFGDEYIVSDNLKSGRLIYTITGAYVITNTADLPETGGFVDYASVIFADVDDPTGADIYRYPDFIQESGEFIDGVCMVLVDFTVKSDNAEAYTSNDVDDEGYSRSILKDKYLFSITPELVDFSIYFDGNKEMRPYYWGKAYDYCGWMNEINQLGEPDQEWCLFRAEPGEERKLTMGYLVSDKNEGGNNDLSSLCLAYYGGALDNNIFVDLHLTEGGE